MEDRVTGQGGFLGTGQQSNNEPNAKLQGFYGSSEPEPHKHLFLNEI